MCSQRLSKQTQMKRNRLREGLRQRKRGKRIDGKKLVQGNRQTRAGIGIVSLLNAIEGQFVGRGFVTVNVSATLSVSVLNFKKEHHCNIYSEMSLNVAASVLPSPAN